MFRRNFNQTSKCFIHIWMFEYFRKQVHTGIQTSPIERASIFRYFRATLWIIPFVSLPRIVTLDVLKSSDLRSPNTQTFSEKCPCNSTLLLEPLVELDVARLLNRLLRKSFSTRRDNRSYTPASRRCVSRFAFLLRTATCGGSLSRIYIRRT